MTVEVDMKGIGSLDAFFRDVGDRAEVAERLAVSNTSRWARSEASRQIRSQVNFTVSYLNDAGRLERVIKSGGKEASITGRHRATSLANPVFNKTQPFFGRPKKGSKIRVRVTKRGPGHTFTGAFFLPLKNGNVGLAVRTPDGRPPSAGAKPIFGGAAHLLYGPSVGQVAFDVFPDIAPEVGDRFGTEFLRQMERR